MRGQRLADHAVDEVTHPVRQRVEIRVVNLLDVAGEDDLGPFACTGDDRFDFVRRQVLSFIDDEEDSLVSTQL